MAAGEPLARHTTLRIGGPADFFVEPETETALRALLSLCREYGVDVHFLGQGSNVLVPDEGVRGVVLTTRRLFNRCTFAGTEVTVGSGYALGRLVQLSLERGLGGLEPLAGIPGTVGGAVFMNAGTAAGTIGDRLVWARLLDLAGEESLLSREEMGFGYRTSRLQQEPGRLVAEVRLRLEEAPQVSADLLRAAAARRRRTQPLSYPNAGSIFRNPPGDYAGRLIEAVGAKGLAVGGAQISPLHANFIVNTGGATAADVLELMRIARGLVRERFGLTLVPEIRLFGAPAGTLERRLDEGGGETGGTLPD
ncbi:MAG: UDP-N-acetylmuramate dehydrogenase [Bacillota bacterium]|nr:UDP-N-acetylmuramate dehydrogenase [Bacillota bacterium]